MHRRQIATHLVLRAAYTTSAAAEGSLPISMNEYPALLRRGEDALLP